MDAEKDAWRIWCRLCARTKLTSSLTMLLKAEKETSENEFQMEDDIEERKLILAVQKHFDVNLQDDDNMPRQLCSECFSMISTLINYVERVRKVQKMFTALKLQEKRINIDLHDVRVQFGLFEDEPAVQATNGENYFESKSMIAVTNDTMDSLDKNPLEFMTNDDHISDDDNSDDDTCEVNLTTISRYNSARRVGTLVENLKKLKTKGKSQNIERASKRKIVDDDDFCSGSTFSCTNCNQKFKRIQGYRIHMKMAHSIILPDPEYPCTECTRTFNTKFKLKKHQKLHLPLEQRKIIPCPHCEKKFTSDFLVRAHIKHSHMNVRTFVCEECGLAVSTNGTLKRHMLTHTDLAAYGCHICQRRFKFQFQLTNHLETHDPKKHICAECGLQLNSRVTLSRHLLVHSDEMPHKCEFCGRAFKRWKSLKVHLILHTGVKPYACNFCDLTFAAGTNCRVHMKKLHAAQFQASQVTENQKEEQTPHSGTT